MIGETPESAAIRQLIDDLDRLRAAFDQLQRASRDHEARIATLEGP